MMYSQNHFHKYSFSFKKLTSTVNKSPVISTYLTTITRTDLDIESLKIFFIFSTDKLDFIAYVVESDLRQIYPEKLVG